MEVTISLSGINIRLLKDLIVPQLRVQSVLHIIELLPTSLDIRLPATQVSIQRLLWLHLNELVGLGKPLLSNIFLHYHILVLGHRCIEIDVLCRFIKQRL